MDLQPGSDGEGESLDVVILSGQSNMAGRGGVHAVGQRREWDGFVPQESWAPNGTIKRLNVDLEWEDAAEPLHRDIDTGKVCGIGPGLTFGAALINQQRSRFLGLVPCAKGATSITEWTKGSFLYERMIKRAKEAIRKGGVLRALLWYQGETDTLSEHLARNYKRALEAFIGNVRSDLGWDQLPFIQVSGSLDFVLVRQAQQQIHIANVFYVDAHGLALQEDGVHLTTASQVELGKKLAQSFISNVPP
ncbi:hypothetical protein SELMODRAFT_122285 [Selaginella moellendorffii]|uniref:Sialate O-acetylesterase domain-containing protein n=1 Tax=Selaginella moellendorffii TaxID=88036 RepID=D8SPS0_SELML|nr:hypothetical protein SELMODRAFT_125405 [Selaginella moellendorffii]EFJ13463.1 hypothetical protein SELMODRAFT_122285 [Selaginella moellendorffii]